MHPFINYQSFKLHGQQEVRGGRVQSRGRTSRFGDGRSPAGRVEPVSRDGVCLTTVGLLRKERAKKEESAVELAKRSPALPSTYEAQPAPGRINYFAKNLNSVVES